MELDAVLDVERSAGRAPGDNLVVVKGEGFTSEGWMMGSFGRSELDAGDWGFVGETSGGLVRVHMASKGDQRVPEADGLSKFRVLTKPESRESPNWLADCATAGRLDKTGADEESSAALDSFIEKCQELQVLQEADDILERRRAAAAGAEQQQQSHCDVPCTAKQIPVKSVNHFVQRDGDMVPKELKVDIEEKYLGKCLNSCYVKPKESKAAGCPLLYGNVGHVCEWEPVPPTRFYEGHHKVVQG